MKNDPLGSAPRPLHGRSGTITQRLAMPAVLAAIIPFTGCMVGPTYVAPAADLPDAWLDVKSTAPTASDQYARWWGAFEDPTLNSLVDEALANNLTLRQAGLRVIRARAIRGVAVGQLFPQSQVATGEANNTQLSRNSPQGSADRSYSNYAVGLEAAWELDFWGRFRRGIESADASLDASIADFDAAMVVIAGDVASTYVFIRSMQEQLQYTVNNVQAQQDTLTLTEVRLNAGAVSELDVATARATLANTQSLVPQLEDALRQATLSLGVLLGRPPSQLDAEIGSPAPVPVAPADIAVGIPADLLRRRPDVRRAERVAAALSAEIGIATADLYPSISIKGLTGFRTSSFESAGPSPGPENLFDASSFEGFIGLDINWPILNYGRIQNNIRAADARFQEAVVAYQNTVLEAAADVEAGLSTFLRSRERADYLAQSVVAAERTLELSLFQYRQGAADFLRVNQAQVDLVERQNSLVIARADVAQGAITTFRALGGGWETRAASNAEFIPQHTINEMRERTNWGDILPPDSPSSPPPPPATIPADPAAGDVP